MQQHYLFLMNQARPLMEVCSLDGGRRYKITLPSGSFSKKASTRNLGAGNTYAPGAASERAVRETRTKPVKI